jgi:hypothetical protein
MNFVHVLPLKRKPPRRWLVTHKADYRIHCARCGGLHGGECFLEEGKPMDQVITAEQFARLSAKVDCLAKERDEARQAARFCWTCGCKNMWGPYRREALGHWPWLEEMENQPDETNPL